MDKEAEELAKAFSRKQTIPIFTKSFTEPSGDEIEVVVIRKKQTRKLYEERGKTASYDPPGWNPKGSGKCPLCGN